ncbi:hypothetical protein PR202_ga17121 [Eleusine coracana subsp. coracana]|uniref:F-box domain-containing protein n=1 Tax=Eleusine coracana subsp. coracana TaxID=191504 RepID=A0AAV5CPC5_ELECO|nr:hypothetical protein PR202_ga17121 [Eleusine coracana subsp. coracana]
MEEQEDLVKPLPSDVLAVILHRLAPRFLAASRCICNAWRDVVDGCGLLQTDHLPLSLAGIFINFQCLDITKFFSRPAMDRSICGNHDYFPEAAADIHSCSKVIHHCNGLLLVAVD